MYILYVCMWVPYNVCKYLLSGYTCNTDHLLWHVCLMELHTCAIINIHAHVHMLMYHACNKTNHVIYCVHT